MQPKLYERVPPDFMKGVFLAPHNFSDPQDKSHGEYVHMEIRQDLYDQALNTVMSFLNQISSIESESKEIRVLKIEPCRQKDSLVQYLKTWKYTTDIDVMLTCEDWVVQNDAKQKNTYRVKMYQSKLDRFFGLTFPPQFMQYLQMYRSGLM